VELALVHPSVVWKFEMAGVCFECLCSSSVRSVHHEVLCKWAAWKIRKEMG